MLGKLMKDIKKMYGRIGTIKRWQFGYCPYCNRRTVFFACDYSFRDLYYCVHCFSSSRNRALVKVLNEVMPNWKTMAIHESSPTNTSFKYNKFKSECNLYSYSYFHEDKELGAILENNCTNQNLEDLKFDNGSFDIFITQDVLEHLYNPFIAFREIARVLRGGGIHIFTVPIANPFKPSSPRIQIVNGKVSHLSPPIYHKNPISEEGSLVTYDWGYDIVQKIEESSGMQTEIYEFSPSKDNSKNGIEGYDVRVFVSKKST